MPPSGLGPRGPSAAGQRDQTTCGLLSSSQVRRPDDASLPPPQHPHLSHVICQPDYRKGLQRGLSDHLSIQLSKRSYENINHISPLPTAQVLPGPSHLLHKPLCSADPSPSPLCSLRDPALAPTLGPLHLSLFWAGTHFPLSSSPQHLQGLLSHLLQSRAFTNATQGSYIRQGSEPTQRMKNTGRAPRPCSGCRFQTGGVHADPPGTPHWSAGRNWGEAGVDLSGHCEDKSRTSACPVAATSAQSPRRKGN